MKCIRLLAAATLCAATSGAQAADGLLPDGLSISSSIASDYLFRGVAQTRGKVATQLTADYLHQSGFYVGAFASNVDFRDAGNARQAWAELDLLGGMRGEVGKLAWDLGLVGYAYPGSPSRLNYTYVEAVAKGAYDFGFMKANALLAASPQFQGRSGSALYLEVGPDVAVGFDITASARLGRQFIDRNPLFGLPDYTNWSIALSRELLPRLTLTAGYYATDVSRAQCGSNACDARFAATLAYSF